MDLEELERRMREDPGGPASALWADDLSDDEVERAILGLATRTGPVDQRLVQELYARTTHDGRQPQPATVDLPGAPPPALRDSGAFAPYRVARELGQGGMGVVLEVVHAQTGARFALKTLRPEEAVTKAALDTARARFQREVDLSARLQHPHIVAVHDARLDVDPPWVVLELLPGGSLAERIERTGALPVPEALRLALQLGRALAHAHAHGVLHRDLKPENVLFDAQGRPVLVDFGLALSLRESGVRFTRTGEVVGTPAFLAPEQISEGGRRDTASVDVYGLGAVLYTCLTDALPIPLDGVTNVLDALRAILGRQPVSPRALRPEVPPEVERLVLDLLIKDPAGRPSLESALARLARLCGEDQEPPPAAGSASRTSAPGSLGAPPLAGWASWSLPARLLAGSLAIVAALGAAIPVAVALRERQEAQLAARVARLAAGEAEDPWLLGRDLERARSRGLLRAGYRALLARAPRPSGEEQWRARRAWAAQVVALQVDPEASALLALGEAEAALGDAAAAAATLQRARAAGAAEALLPEARALVASGQPDRARALLEERREADPRDLAALEQLVALETGLARWDEAALALRRLANGREARLRELLRETPGAAPGPGPLSRTIQACLVAATPPAAARLRFELLCARGDYDGALALAAHAPGDTALALAAFELACVWRGARHPAAERWLRRLRELPPGAPERRVAELASSSERLGERPPPAAWTAALTRAPAPLLEAHYLQVAGASTAAAARGALARARELREAQPLSPLLAARCAALLLEHHAREGEADALREQLAAHYALREHLPEPSSWLLAGHSLLLLGQPRAARRELEEAERLAREQHLAALARQAEVWQVVACLAAGDEGEAQRRAAPVHGVELAREPALAPLLGSLPAPLARRLTALLPGLR
ncbi:MAG: protein kinase [Planctomycetota bacterium]